jgi:hypothetical protein
VKPPVLHAVSVITRSLWVRFHMSLILLLVSFAGIGSSFVLLRLGVRSMPARYTFAVLLGYLLFLSGVRFWLWYARRTLPHLEREVIEVDEGTRPAPVPRQQRGSDGSSRDDLAAAADVLEIAGEGCMVNAVVALVVAAVGGIAAYILVATPELLGEALVQLALAAALRRKGKAFNGGHWTGSVVRATWGPVLIALFAAVSIGFLIQASCPSAMTLFDAISRCH